MLSVCLRRPDHYWYKDLIEYPPNNCRYVITGKAIGKYTKKRGFVGNIKNKIMKYLQDNDFSTYLYYRFRDQLYRTNYDNVDLIHVCDHFITEQKMPWVCDLEHASAIVGFKPRRLKSTLFLNMIERGFSSDACKRIMPTSFAAEKSITNSIPCQKFKDKFEVMYPSLRPPKFTKAKGGKINILFIGKNFLWKGGREFINASKRLSKKYDFTANMITDVPEEYKKDYSGDESINIYPAKFSRDEIYSRFFSKADFFVFPSMGDTFGYVVLEAMSFGLPVIGLNIHAAVPEMVIDGKTGLLAEPELELFNTDYTQTLAINELEDKIRMTRQPRLENDLYEKMSLLIDDSSMRKKLGRNAQKEVVSGKFSIEKRNKQLERIYEESSKR